MQGRLLRAVLVATILASFFASAPALAVEECDDPPGNLIQDLVGWIAADSEYDVSATLADPPDIQFCATGETIPYLGGSVLVEPGDLAYFDFQSRRIFLVAPWRIGDPRDVGVLLHELVHDVQFLNRTWECPSATEWEAHKLHERWLQQQGIDPGFDWLGVYFRARCPRDIHP